MAETPVTATDPGADPAVLPPSSTGKCYSPATTGVARCAYHKHFDPKNKLPTRCTHPVKAAGSGGALPLSAAEIAHMECPFYTPDSADNKAMIERYRELAAATGAGLEILGTPASAGSASSGDRKEWEKALGVADKIRIGKEMIERYPDTGHEAMVPKLPFTYIDNVNKVQGSFLEFVARSINDNEIAVVIGHLGAGKTTGILEVTNRIGAPTVVINCDGQLTVDQVIGSRVPGIDADGNTTLIWVDAPLLQAYRNGYVAVIDDYTFTGSDVFSAIFGLMTNDSYQVLSTGEIVTRHPMFRLFLTTNPPERMELYPNRQQTDAAFQSRIQVRYWVDYLPPAEERKAMRAAATVLPDDTLNRMQQVIKVARQHMEDGSLNFVFSTRHAVAWARKTSRLGDMARAAWETMIADMDEETKTSFLKLLDTQID